MLRRVFVLLLLLVFLTTAQIIPEPTASAENMPYTISVDLTNQIVTIYSTSDNTIVRQMLCSTGLRNSTPTGTFTLPKNQRKGERQEWYYFNVYNCYAKYATRIYNGIMFHSIPYNRKRDSSISKKAVDEFGQPASHGCIRLRPEDAEWIAKNCPNGTPCHIYHSWEVDEGLRGLLLLHSYAEGGEWASYADFAQGAGGLAAAVQSMVTQQRIEGVVAEVTPTPMPGN